MTSEEIAHLTYESLEKFLRAHLDVQLFSDFIQEKEKLFPTWKHLWQQLQPWLSQYTACDMPTTILSLTQLLPTNPKFLYSLQQSLCIHEQFWNKVYINVLEAKRRLSC